MNRKNLRRILIGAALGVAVIGAGLSARARSDSPPETPAASRAIGTLEPFELARLLSQGAPDVVVIALDQAERPLLGATPVAMFGADDEAFVAAAPKARRIVLVGADPVRVDRLARRLAASGRDVRVLAGGTTAWDEAMKADPAAPAANATADERERYLEDVALRRYFGDEAAAPPPIVAAPVVPVVAPSTAPRKREGC